MAAWTFARALKAAITEDARPSHFVTDRHAGWQGAEARAMLGGERSLDEIASGVLAADTRPEPVSGWQEYLENLVIGSFDEGPGQG